MTKPDDALALPTPSVREVVADGVRWVMRSDAAEALKASGALKVWKLEGVKRPQRLEMWTGETKAWTGRTEMWNSAAAAGSGKEARDVEVTLFHRPRARDVARSLVGPARAMRAWRAAQALEEAGLPTVRVLAAGTKRSAGILREDVLIREASDALPLNEFLKRTGEGACAASTGSERGNLIRSATTALAQLVRAMHEAGLSYCGFDAECVLVEEGAAGRQLLLGGLERLRKSPAAPLGVRLDNLAQLAASMPDVSRAQRRRFFREYARGIPAAENRESDYARLVESHAEVLRRRRWKRLEREAVGTNAHFKRVRVGRWSGWTVRARIELEREVLARISEAGMAMPDATVIKDSPEARVYEQRLDFGAGAPTFSPVVRPPCGPVASQERGTPQGRRTTGAEVETIIVKHKRRVGAAGVLRTFLRSVGAAASWRTLQAMRIRGLPVERPLAAFERRCCGLTFESVLVTRKVEDAENLYRFAERLLKEPRAAAGRSPAAQDDLIPDARRGSDPPRLRRELARALGRLACRMHDAGFSQRDLKAANILVQADESRGVALTLVDVEGVRRAESVSMRLRARDLGRLAADFARMPGVSATDFARTLDEYLAGRDLSPATKRRFIARINGRVREKLDAWDSKKS